VGMRTPDPVQDLNQVSPKYNARSMGLNHYQEEWEFSFHQYGMESSLYIVLMSNCCVDKGSQH
jgi:hypothetical protein